MVLRRPSGARDSKKHTQTSLCHRQSKYLITSFLVSSPSLAWGEGEPDPGSSAGFRAALLYYPGLL